MTVATVKNSESVFRSFRDFFDGQADIVDNSRVNAGRCNYERFLSLANRTVKNGVCAHVIKLVSRSQQIGKQFTRFHLLTTLKGSAGQVDRIGNRIIVYIKRTGIFIILIDLIIVLPNCAS